MPDFRTTCLCPDPWCPVHAKDIDGHPLIIDDPDGLAFCETCGMDRLPVGVCRRNA